MPLLAWSSTMGKHVQRGGKHHSKFVHFMIRYQALFYFPILFLARLSWVYSSLSVVIEAVRGDTATKAKHGTSYLVRRLGIGLEFFGLLLHYVVYGMLVAKVYSEHGGLWAFAFVFSSQTISGLLLAIVFGLGHNGMETYAFDARPDFWRLQCTTTRNIHNDSFGFVGWFTGGLHLQIEHHLCPTMPRHNLRLVQPVVRKFCEKHGVHYRSQTLWNGTKDVLQHLDTVAKQIFVEFPSM